jgi:hypothetical protein
LSVGLEKSCGRRTHNEASLSHQRCSDPFARQQHIPHTNPQRMGHGEGQVVLLSGEPGIRKSRVLTTLRERLEAQGVLAVRFQCSPYYVNSAFWPIIDNFERTLKYAREERWTRNSTSSKH